MSLAMVAIYVAGVISGVILVSIALAGWIHKSAMKIKEKQRGEAPAPSQVRRPWRTTARTVIGAAFGLLPLLPDIARAAEVDTVPAVVSILAITAAITRIAAIPEVDAWLDRYLPWISADPEESGNNDYQGRHRAE